MQIFSNLLSNAVKYTQEGGKIQFLVEECETNSSVYAKYRFLVRDNGIGMSADFKETIRSIKSGGDTETQVIEQ